jgi:hypothetical protein
MLLMKHNRPRQTDAVCAKRPKDKKALLSLEDERDDSKSAQLPDSGAGPM